MATTAGASGRLLASTGATLLGSTDTGCSWQPLYQFSASAADLTTDPTVAAAENDPDYQIIDIATSKPSLGKSLSPESVYLLLGRPELVSRSGFSGAAPLFLAASHDGGTTWSTRQITATTAGAPRPTPVMGSTLRQAGKPVHFLYVSDSDPRSLYLVVATGANTNPSVLASPDAGSTWAYGAPPAGLPAATPFVIDPKTAAVSYLLTGQQIWTSTDRAKTWHVLSAPVISPSTLTGLSVVPATRPKTGPSLLVTAQTAAGPAFLISGDGGRHWGQAPAIPAVSQRASAISAWFGAGSPTVAAVVNTSDGASDGHVNLCVLNGRHTRWSCGALSIQPKPTTSTVAVSAGLAQTFEPIDQTRAGYFGVIFQTNGIPILVEYSRGP